jgi:hypothetical protein
MQTTAHETAGGNAAADTIEILRSIALRSLRRMYLPSQGLFCHCIRRTPAGDVPEGVSRRYTAITLIGLAEESSDEVKAILAGKSPQDVCEGLVDSLMDSRDIGETALSLWAARRVDSSAAGRALDRLRTAGVEECDIRTVELSWCLTALTAPGSDVTDAGLAKKIARRLLASFHESSGLFSHWPAGSKTPPMRGHVCCFADLVYPTQALSFYHAAVGDEEALRAAGLCAERMCRGQGPDGQWWWHHDIRTGRVVEKYPVYSVHQDAMAPMALLDCDAVSGSDHGEAVRRGVEWMNRSPEIGASLIDPAADVIWRKVMRREPNKLVRAMQTFASGIHSGLRVPFVETLFPPACVDWESRPYHMGWILYAFAPSRANAFWKAK